MSESLTQAECDEAIASSTREFYKTEEGEVSTHLKSEPPDKKEDKKQNQKETDLARQVCEKHVRVHGAAKEEDGADKPRRLPVYNEDYSDSDDEGRCTDDEAFEDDVNNCCHEHTNWVGSRCSTKPETHQAKSIDYICDLCKHYVAAIVCAKCYPLR